MTKTTCKFLLTAATLMAVFTTVSAQKKSIVIHSVAGFNAPQLSAFNTVLASEGLPQFRDFYFTRGGGFYTTFPKARLATLFNFATFSGNKKTGDQSNWLRSTQAGTSLGFLLKNSEEFQVIPYAGVMYSFFGARVTADNVRNSSFANYFGGPSNQYHVSLNQFMGHVGLHVSKVGIGNSRLFEKTVIGFRAGYFIPTGKGKWKSNETELSNGPSVNPGGLYATFLLGLQQ